MPKIPPQVLHSPFYLYHSLEDAKSGERFGGTGFFVAYPANWYPEESFLYAVTNWHVAVRDGASVMRINRHDGGVDILEFEPHEWEFIPGGPDLAVLPHSSFGLSESVHHVVGLHVNMFLGRVEAANLGIGPGDDVFMIGRFVDHDGAASNVPSARFGNISVMPQPVGQPTGSQSPSFILDVHSRTGYSGSPVFVYRTYGSDLTTDRLAISPDTHFIKLLGIHWGQFPEQWEIETGKKITLEGVSLADDAKYINGLSGMTLAIPAWTLREFLEMPKFKEERRRANDELVRRRGSAPIAESAPVPNETNPKHKEDFSRLLKQAAQKRERED